MTDIEILAERLKKAMDARHVSAHELAEKTGVHPATIYRYLTGKFKGARLSTQKLLANCLNVPIEYLLGLADSMETVQEVREPSTDITGDEKVLLDLFSRVPPERRQEAIEQFAVVVVRIALQRDQ